MAYKWRDVDLDLFVNAASKGFNDGAKVPGPFAAFLTGLSEGIDQNYENELKAQQAESLRIQNEREPYEDAIKIAQAERAKLETQAMQENPDVFKDSIIKKAETEKKALEQQAALQQKATTFTDIMQKGTSQEKAQATIGGEYADLFAAKPEYYKMAERSVPFWEPQDKDKFWEFNNQQTKAAYYADRKVKNEILYEETEKEFNKDTGITNLANLVSNGSRPDLLLHGTVKRELVGDLRKETVIDPITKKETVSIVPKPTGDQKWQDVFYYKDKPYYNADPETLKVFSSHQEPWKVKREAMPDQGGIGTIKEESNKVDDARAVQQAQAQEKAKTTATQELGDREKFLSGMGVAKRDIVERSAPSQSSAPALPQGRTPEVTATPTRSVVVSPVKTTGPAPEPTPPAMPPPAGTPSPEAASVRQREELNRAKARAYSERRKVGKAPQEGTMQATPVQQAANATEPRSIPAAVEVKISTREPDEEVVNKVLSMPAMKGTDALFKAVVSQESAGNPNAVSETGVTGLAQTTLPTAQDVDPTIKTREELKDPAKSARIGNIRLQSLTSTYKADPIIALIGYNAGPGVAAELVRLTGVGASWEEIQANIPKAVEKFYGKGSPKVKEVKNYPGMVLRYFPKYLQTQSDMQLAELLKEQGIISYA